MKRGEGLKVDAAKVGAWQQRSRERAVRRAQDRARELQAAGGREGMKSAQLRRSAAQVNAEKIVGPTLARQRGERLATDEERFGPPGRKRVVFKARVPARRKMCRCGARASGYHHWLPQQQIRKAMVARARRDGLSNDVHDTQLRDLLRDDRNLSPLCARCHQCHELRVEAFEADDVPLSAHVFAAELGPEWAERLRRMYPAAGHAADRTDGGA